MAMSEARCPKPGELPVKYDNSRFFCARVYANGHRNAALSCTGRTQDIFNGEYTTSIGRFQDQISSIVVRPGCTLHAFEHPYYGGGHGIFTGVWHQLSGFWDNLISSWTCDCDFSNKALTCTPREEYEVLKVCRNPSNGSMECDHAVTKGMEIGKSVTHGKSVSYSVSASFGAEFKKKFTASLSASVTTSYDWSKTDTKTFSQTTRTNVKCVVEPGDSLKMVQVVGKCGDTIIYTGYYECQNEKMKVNN